MEIPINTPYTITPLCPSFKQVNITHPQYKF